jgi:hypothetical protein
MKNLIKDIEQNCEDKSIKGIVSFLVERGDINPAGEFPREVYFFYKEALNIVYRKKSARDMTIEMFDINWKKFNRIRNKFEDSHKRWQ